MSKVLEQALVYQDEPIDLFELWEIVWKEKVLVIGVTSLFALGSIFYALAQTDIYRSSALLLPAETSQPTNPLLAQLGAAAGIAGIGAQAEGANSIGAAIAIMQSRAFAGQFIERHGLKPHLFAGKWDAQSEQSSLDPAVYDSENKIWVVSEPTDQKAVDVFLGALTVTRDQSSNLVTVAIEWPDPVSAQQWVSRYIEDINNQVKQQDLLEATSSIEYLQEQLETTQLIEMRQALFQLIESQLRVVMLADVRDDYVFRTVDPAYVPEQAARPSRSTICIVGTLLGGTLALGLVAVLHAVRKRKTIKPK